MLSDWVLMDLLTRKIKIRCIKSTVLFKVHYLSEMVRILIKQLDLDLYQIEKQDPGPYQSENQDLDLYQKGLNLQHVFECKKSLLRVVAIRARCKPHSTLDPCL